MRRAVVVSLLAALALAGCGDGPAPPSAPRAGPDAYERAHRMADEPDPRVRYEGVQLHTKEFLAFAKRYERLVPYPPGYKGRWLWSDGEEEMHKVMHVPQLLIHNASCEWYRYWVMRFDHGVDMTHARETAVLSDLARWPILRDHRAYYEELAESAPLWPSAVRDHVRDHCTASDRPERLERDIRDRPEPGRSTS